MENASEHMVWKIETCMGLIFNTHAYCWTPENVYLTTSVNNLFYSNILYLYVNCFASAMFLVDRPNFVRSLSYAKKLKVCFLKHCRMMSKAGTFIHFIAICMDIGNNFDLVIHQLHVYINTIFFLGGVKWVGPWLQRVCKSCNKF